VFDDEWERALFGDDVDADEQADEDRPLNGSGDILDSADEDDSGSGGDGSTSDAESTDDDGKRRLHNGPGVSGTDFIMCTVRYHATEAHLQHHAPHLKDKTALLAPHQPMSCRICL